MSNTQVLDRDTRYTALLGGQTNISPLMVTSAQLRSDSMSNVTSAFCDWLSAAKDRGYRYADENWCKLLLAPDKEVVGVISLDASHRPRIVAQDHDLLLGYCLFRELASDHKHSSTTNESGCLRFNYHERKSVDDWKPLVIQSKHNLDAAYYVNSIRAFTHLTLEEVAPLLSVSRRTLQHWLNGQRISARNDHRLRKLAETIEAISTRVSGSMRDHLFRQRPGRIRVYDLLREERFESALHGTTLDTGGKSSAHVDLQSMPVASRLELHAERAPGSDGKVNLRASRRLRGR